MRDHLQNSQWKRPDITEELQARRQARPHLYPQHPDEQRFTLQELNDAIGSTKPNKAQAGRSSNRTLHNTGPRLERITATPL